MGKAKQDWSVGKSVRGRRNKASSAPDLLTTLFGSSDAPTRAQYDAQIAFLDKLIAAHKAALKSERDASKDAADSEAGQ